MRQIQIHSKNLNLIFTPEIWFWSALSGNAHLQYRFWQRQRDHFKYQNTWKYMIFTDFDRWCKPFSYLEFHLASIATRDIRSYLIWLRVRLSGSKLVINGHLSSLKGLEKSWSGDKSTGLFWPESRVRARPKVGSKYTGSKCSGSEVQRQWTYMYI